MNKRVGDLADPQRDLAADTLQRMERRPAGNEPHRLQLLLPFKGGHLAVVDLRLHVTERVETPRLEHRTRDQCCVALVLVGEVVDYVGVFGDELVVVAVDSGFHDPARQLLRIENGFRRGKSLRVDRSSGPGGLLRERNREQLRELRRVDRASSEVERQAG
jgi:hypothetical protein